MERGEGKDDSDEARESFHFLFCPKRRVQTIANFRAANHSGNTANTSTGAAFQAFLACEAHQHLGSVYCKAFTAGLTLLKKSAAG